MLPKDQQIRRLNLHEFQSMEIMQKYGVAIPPGIAASTAEEADAAYKKLRTSDGKYCVIVHKIDLNPSRQGCRDQGTSPNWWSWPRTLYKWI